MDVKKYLFYLLLAFPLLAVSAGAALAAPAPVTDLSIIGTGFSHVTLSWTVPYDAGSSTTPAFYQIRTSTYLPLVDDTDWANNSSSSLYPYRITISTSEVTEGQPQFYTVTGLANGTGVFFAVETSTDGASWSAIDTAAPRPYGTPFNTNPDSVGGHNLLNGTVVFTSTPTLSWSVPLPGDSDDLYGDSIVSYTVELATDTSFSVKTVKDNIPANSWISYLLADATFYWRVKALDSAGAYSSGFVSQSSRRFVVDGVNQLPYPFNLNSPIGDIIIPTNSPQFSWGSTTDPDPVDTVTYSLYYSTAPDFDINVTTAVTGYALTQYTVLDPLMENARYYWKVYAVDQKGSAGMSSSTGTLRVNGNTTEAPLPFNLASPADGAMVTSATPLLTWQASTDPDPGDTITYTVDFSSYDASLGVFGEFTSSAGIVPVQYNTPALQENTTYWWRATAYDNGGLYVQASTRTLYVNAVSNPPSAFDLIAASGIARATLTPVLSWNPSTDPDGGAISYTVYYSSFTDFNTYISSAGLTATAWAPVNALRENATYYWKVRAVKQSSAYTVSNETWTIITDTAAENPLAFSLISPADASSAGYLKPTLVWQDTTDPDPFDYVQDYTLYYSTLSDFSVQAQVTGITVSSYTFAGALQNSSTYWWKVQANSVLSGATTSQTWRFKAVNQAPFAFSLIASSGIIGTASPLLTWQDAVDPESDAVAYTLYYSSYSNFSSYISSEGLTVASYSLAALEENKTYYWYAAAVDTWGNTRQSAQWSFSVNAGVEAPAAFSLLSPLDGSVTYSVRPTLDWQDSSTADPGTTLTYTLWYSQDATFAARTAVTGIAASTYNIQSNLTPGTTVYWRVYAASSNGLETVSQTWGFYVGTSVMPAAPRNFTLANLVEGRSIRLTWDTVTKNTDGSDLSNLAGFRIYRAYTFDDIFASSSVVCVAASALAWEDGTVNNQTVYYAVRAFTSDFIDGEYSAVQVASNDNQTIVSDAGRDIIISFHPEAVPSTMTVEVARLAEEETGNVLRAFRFLGRAADGSVFEGMLSQPITIKIKSPASAAIAASPAAAQRAPGSATLTTGIFWNNGIEWIYLGGEKDGDSVTIEASSFGHYQLRTVARATDFRLLSLWPRIITPNGDSINDEFNITFENPTAERVEGSIYDLSGMFIAKMVLKTELWLSWGGVYESSSKVPAGIYFYQVKVGSKVRHGTVVVAK
jgi:hypothetical protein